MEMLWGGPYECSSGSDGGLFKALEFPLGAEFKILYWSTPSVPITLTRLSNVNLNKVTPRSRLEPLEKMAFDMGHALRNGSRQRHSLY